MSKEERALKQGIILCVSSSFHRSGKSFPEDFQYIWRGQEVVSGTGSPTLRL